MGFYKLFVYHCIKILHNNHEIDVFLLNFFCRSCKNIYYAFPEYGNYIFFLKPDFQKYFGIDGIIVFPDIIMDINLDSINIDISLFFLVTNLYPFRQVITEGKALKQYGLTTKINST